jgi:hypothetical protein|tara:strand:+ start:103903 stop:104742 length:840 start_codon:yes stop_codon:yes gene_type:complete
MKRTHIINTLALLTLSNTVAYAGTMSSEKAMEPTGKVYLGAFGGGGTISSVPVGQKGTAYFSDTSGGPLAVNSKGSLDKTSGWVAGGHIGYQGATRTLNHVDSHWSLAPSIELEGFYIGDVTLKGHEINNDTARLTEHDFLITLPMKTGVYLTNFVLQLNTPFSEKVHPYLGLGAGAAVVSITNATSIQTAPEEPFNHFNSDTNDTGLSFAAQPKIGISVNLKNSMHLFAEYRFLYISASDYTFGSTVYPGQHVATSNWNIKVHSKFYNFGTIGLQYDL